MTNLIRWATAPGNGMDVIRKRNPLVGLRTFARLEAKRGGLKLGLLEGPEAVPESSDTCVARHVCAHVAGGSRMPGSRDWGAPGSCGI